MEPSVQSDHVADYLAELRPHFDDLGSSERAEVLDELADTLLFDGVGQPLNLAPEGEATAEPTSPADAHTAAPSEPAGGAGDGPAPDTDGSP